MTTDEAALNALPQHLRQWISDMQDHVAECGTRMSTDEAVAALDAIDGEDPEGAHKQADEILLAVVPVEVRDAYHRLSGDDYRVDGRASWWAWA